jgi:hypothetical protein
VLDIDLSKLNFQFTSKPLLIGGKAMEYYGLRPSGADIDFVISVEDHARLWQQYPDCHKELWGDYGVCTRVGGDELEIWDSICLLDYNALTPGAVDEDDILVISLEKLLLLKALAIRVPKYQKDLELLVDHITRRQYDSLYSSKKVSRLASSRFLGKWQLDPAESAYQFGELPASGMYTVEFDGERLHCTMEWTTAEGQAQRQVVDAVPDGFDHPHDNPAQADTVCYALVDDYTLDSTAKKQGAVSGYARRMLSKDGDTMTIVQSGTTPEGKHFDNLSVYRRV